MQSSQSRIAKIEAGEASVSLDLIIRAIFSTGATREDIAKAIALVNCKITFCLKSKKVCN